MKTTCSIVLALAWSACGRAAPAPETPPATSQAKPPGPPACAPEFVGQLAAESVDVAIDGDHIYWHDYNFGRIESRPRGGGVTAAVVAGWDDGHNSEDMLAHGRSLYWSSKVTQGLYRVGRSGGEVEQLATADVPPTEIAIAGGVLYARTLDDQLFYVELDSREHGPVPLPWPVTAIASSSRGLLVAGGPGIHSLAAPSAALVAIAETGEAKVDALLSSGDEVWFLQELEEKPHLFVLAAGGPPTATPLLDSAYALWPAPGGVYLAYGNVLMFVTPTDLRQGKGVWRRVAVLPADITDVAYRETTIVAGTTSGSVHQLCHGDETPLTERPARQGEPPDCPAGSRLHSYSDFAVCRDDQGRGVGIAREWYFSGAVRSEHLVEDGLPVSKSYYADGSLALRLVGSFDDKRESEYYYANGQLAWKQSRNPDGTTSKKSFDLDGTARK